MTDVLDEAATDRRSARRSRRRWYWVAAALAVAAVAFVLIWFQPQKLFIDDRVEETIPTATPAPATAAGEAGGDDPATTVPVGEPVEVARGEFVSRDHGTSGVARILELPDGRRIVRLEGLDTDNGPDLYLYLGTNPADGDEGAFDDDYLNLGRLKGNQGDQNYDLPDGTDIARYATIVIWCDRFDSAFGAAGLTTS